VSQVLLVRWAIEAVTVSCADSLEIGLNENLFVAMTVMTSTSETQLSRRCQYG
jgi:hypothetical protein